MRVKCKNCLPKEGIDIPDFSDTEKQHLISLTSRSRLEATGYLHEKLKLSLRDAKYIATHINSAYGHCNRCNYKQLGTGYINCPQCGALNLNWKNKVSLE